MSNSIKTMSYSDAYLGVEGFDNEDQLFQQQFYVTDQCFVVSDTKSRKQTCEENGMTVRFYDGTGCAADTVTSVTYYNMDTCIAPWQEIPDDTTDLALLIETTYRTLSACRNREDEPLPRYL